MKRLDFRVGSIVIVVGLFCGVVTFSAAPPPLPEGNGLAAAYPNDTGIASDSRVLFADGFESYTSASQLTSSGNYQNYFQQQNITPDTSTFAGGAKSLRIRMPQSGSEVSNAIVRTISPDRDAMFMRVYARYAPNYTGVNSAHNAMRITGNYTGPGRRPNGTDFFLVNIEHSHWSNEPQPGWTHAYVYVPEQTDVYGEHWFSDGTVTNGTYNFGPNFIPRPNVAPTRGTWQSFEMMVQLNTPGVRDGRVAAWQDGQLIADWQNIRFRDVTSVKIDEIQLENGGQASTQINDKWYDNLVIATSYIGPKVTGTTTAPRPPTNLRIVR